MKPPKDEVFTSTCRLITYLMQVAWHDLVELQVERGWVGLSVPVRRG